MAVKVNFVLIDFENVQALPLEKLHGLPVEIRVFLGPHQCKLPLELVMSVQPFGKAAQYIQLASNGKNALDFHVVFYLGKLASENPGAFFHILSKDTGFDPLIAHLKTQKIFCQRWETVEQIPLVKAASLSPAEKLASAKTLLTNPKTPKPATMAKLRNMLKTHFKSALSDGELEEMLRSLEAAKLFKIGAEGKLTFPTA